MAGDNDVGSKVGGGIHGIFKSIHGAGEAIRGNINNALDGLGDGIANREHGSVKSQAGHDGEGNVATKGEAEFKEGISQVTGEHKSAKTSSA